VARKKISQAIEEKLSLLPDRPGVYSMYNEAGKIIYIGKAKSLRKRVPSYFRRQRRLDLKTILLRSEIANFEYTITASEREALNLEANLVRKHRPVYNIRLKDDKSYPYIKLTAEPYPRAIFTRKVEADGGRYFGPYSVFSVRRMLDLIQEIFQLRECNHDLSKPRQRTCLNYQIKRCLGCCVGKVSADEYERLVDEVAEFIQGRCSGLLDKLRYQMNAYSSKQDYEVAAALRDRVHAIEGVLERQSVVHVKMVDEDYIAVARKFDRVVAQVMFVREGKLLGGEHFRLDGIAGAQDSEILGSFVKLYYDVASSTPPAIYLDGRIDEKSDIEDWLSDKTGRKVKVQTPQRGNRLKTIELAKQNAEEKLREIIKREESDRRAIKEGLKGLKDALHLRRRPHRIECYDISNLGKDNRELTAVGSRVVLIDGVPDKNEYRRYRIRTVESQDDYAMMREVLERRLKEFERYPEGIEALDLILLDGGKGHLGTIYSLLEEKGFAGKIQLAALAKREEEVFLPGRETPVKLAETDPALRLLVKIRDEAHRFAGDYQKWMRSKRMRESILDKIPGVGASRKIDLLRHFKSIKKIAEASVDDLCEVKGVSRELAERIKMYVKDRD
jgi:excinuclease ABC subunit C